jgi:endonuclease YncB( thermonuclease family)
MGKILPFRRLRHGPWSKPPAPPFLRKRRSLVRVLARHVGFCALAVVVVGVGYHLLAPGPDGKFSFPWPDSGPHIGSKTRPTPRTNTQADAQPEAKRPRIVAGRQAIVVDGDSLHVGNEIIRLDGIDAPELRQTCRNADGREWSCGSAARARLADLVFGREVICTERGRDHYGRTLAVCAAGDVRDLGEALVLGGHAMNYDRYTNRYTTAQSHARTVRRGIWSGSFEPPEDWRRRNPRSEAVGFGGR